MFKILIIFLATFSIHAQSTLADVSTPAAAADLQTFWCPPDDGIPILIVIDRSPQRHPVWWIDGRQIEYRLQVESLSNHDAWLVDLEQPTLLGISETRNNNRSALSVSGIKNGEQVAASCSDTTPTFLSLFAQVQPLLSGKLRSTEEALKREKNRNDQLASTLERERLEFQENYNDIQTLRSEASAELTAAQAERKQIQEKEQDLASLHRDLDALEEFVGNIRRDMVNAKDLPSAYSKAFNQHYWALASKLGRTPHSP